MLDRWSGAEHGVDRVHRITGTVRTIDQYRSGTLSREALERANALVSLACGAEFPLSGLHLRRLEETRNGLSALLDAPGG